MFTAEETTDKPVLAVMGLHALFVRLIKPITPVCEATASLHVIRAWLNVKSTDVRVQESVSSSPNVRSYLPEKITDEDAAFRFASECQRAEKAALRLIARAEQCSLGLARKLEKRNFSTDCVNAVISRLLELKLVDDSRFSRLWLESRIRFARSPRRLLISLCGRGIDRDAADAAIKTVLDEETEFTVLMRFVKRYFKKSVRKNEKNSVSIKHLLRNEGFSQQAIMRFTESEAQ